MWTIQLGSKKIKVTQQAYIAFIAIIISFLATLIALLLQKPAIPVIIGVVVIYAIVIPLITYKIHCMRVGECVKLSWFYTVSYIILAIMNVLSMIFVFINIGSNKPVVQPIIYSGTFSKK